MWDATRPSVAPASERVAILGGSFDPITLAHITVLDQAAEALSATEGWLLPTRHQPLRPPPLAGVVDRLELIQAAAAGRPHTRVIDDEARRPGFSHTIDTLDALEREHADRELWWVMGADTARSIQGWHRSADLLARGHFALINRAGTSPLNGPEVRQLGFHPGRTRLVRVTSPAFSSTEVRRRVARGLPVDSMVGEAVAQMITSRGLYR